MVFSKQKTYNNTNNLQLYGIKYSYWIWIIFKQIYLTPRDRTLKGTTTPGQSGPGSNGNEGVLHITHIKCSLVT